MILCGQGLSIELDWELGLDENQRTINPIYSRKEKGGSKKAFNNYLEPPILILPFFPIQSHNNSIKRFIITEEEKINIYHLILITNERRDVSFPFFKSH